MPSRQYEKNGFPTPSGHAQLYAVVNLVMGSKPFPEANEPEDALLASDVAKDYPLTGVTGRRYPIYYHSAFRGIRICARSFPSRRSSSIPRSRRSWASSTANGCGSNRPPATSP